jgi:hypothetical protein
MNNCMYFANTLQPVFVQNFLQPIDYRIVHGLKVKKPHSSATAPSDKADKG